MTKDVRRDEQAVFLLCCRSDILVVGVGEQANKKRVDTSIIQFLRSHRISVEILNTVGAVGH